MISTDALQVGFLSLLMIVNEGVIVNDRYWRVVVNKTTNFIKTINDHFEKRPFLKNELFKKTIVFKNDHYFSIFCCRFHNETIIFLKNENVNIPKHGNM